MAQNSLIEWTEHTFNPWWGCVRVSSGCKNCYAEALAKRYGHDVWGGQTGRRYMSDNHWRQPLQWQKKAKNEGRRMRVFCASMADVFEDKEELQPHRERLWSLIEQTPMLDWLLLTKRPENMQRLAPWTGEWPDNVWAMTTTEDQKNADERLPYLVDIPAKIRGLSVEPLLGAVDLTPWLDEVHWVIVGGESGGKSRQMNPNWVRSLREQCVDANVPFFFKQWGNWIPVNEQGEMRRVSKKVAGRELDGRYWNELPLVAMLS